MKSVLIVLNAYLDKINMESEEVDEILFLNFRDYFSYQGSKKKLLFDNLLHEDPCKIKNLGSFIYQKDSIRSVEHYLLSIKLDNLVSFVESIKKIYEIYLWEKIYFNLDKFSLIHNIFQLLGIKFEEIGKVNLITDMDLLSEINYSTRRMDFIDIFHKEKILNSSLKFQAISKLVNILVNWFTLKKYIFIILYSSKPTTLLLFNRFTSRSATELPQGPIVLCSRYWPKSFSLITKAFFRPNCVVDSFVNEALSVDDIWNTFASKCKAYFDGSDRLDIVHMFSQLRHLAKSSVAIDAKDSHTTKLIKYRVKDVVTPFDSHPPVIELLDSCKAMGIRRHLIQHGIIDYPQRDFLFFDMAYIFSETLYMQLREKGFMKKELALMSNDLEQQPLLEMQYSNSVKIKVKHIYVVSSIAPIFSWIPMHTSLVENIYNAFIKSLVKFDNNIPITVICHPSENLQTYFDINKFYGVKNVNVLSGFDSLKRISENPVFVDLGHSTISVELAKAGGIVLKYISNAESKELSKKFDFKNSKTFFKIDEIVEELRLGLFDYRYDEIPKFNRGLLNGVALDSRLKIERWISSFRSKNLLIKFKYHAD